MSRPLSKGFPAALLSPMKSASRQHDCIDLYRANIAMTCYDLRSSTMCLFREKENSQAPDGGFQLSPWRMRNAHLSGILQHPLTRQLCVRLIWSYFWDLWHFYGLSSNTVWRGAEKRRRRGELDVDWLASFSYRGKRALCNRAVLTI